MHKTAIEKCNYNQIEGEGGSQELSGHSTVRFDLLTLTVLLSAFTRRKSVLAAPMDLFDDPYLLPGRPRSGP